MEGGRGGSASGHGARARALEESVNERHPANAHLAKTVRPIAAGKQQHGRAQVRVAQPVRNVSF